MWERDADGIARPDLADNGIGITDDDQRRIFERFYRVDYARSRDNGGTGLGLAICKRIIDLMGGRIGVHSQPGQGSTFTLRLPEMGRTETITVGSRTLEVSANPHTTTSTDAPGDERPRPSDRPSGKGS